MSRSLALSRSGEARNRDSERPSDWKVGMASPWPPLFSNTNHAMVHCRLRSSKTSPIPHGSPEFILDNATFPMGPREPGVTGFGIALRPWPSHKPSSLAPDFKCQPEGGGGAEFLHSADACHTRYMRRFIPRDRGRLASRSLSRLGCFPPFPNRQPSSKPAVSDVPPSTSAPWNQSNTTARRILQSPRGIMNGANGTNGTHVPNGTNGTNGINGTNGVATQAFVGAIDQGTTSSRFLIFNQRGEVVVTHQIEFTQIYPEPG